MRVLGIRWVGVRADSYDEMVGFLRDVLGLRVAFEDDATAELALENDDRVQVFGPGHRYYELFGAGGDGPVPLFEVERPPDGPRRARRRRSRGDRRDRAGRELGVVQLPRARRQSLRARKPPLALQTARSASQRHP